MSEQKIHRQAREMIQNVLNYMLKEQEEGVHNVTQVQRRAAEATATSIRTVSNIITEAKKMKKNANFRTPGKNRFRVKTVTGLDEFDKGVIRRTINNYYVTEKQLPTTTKLRAKLQIDMDYKGCLSSLTRTIKDLGFRWLRSENVGNYLIEKHDIRLKRIQYLQKIKQYRTEGRTIVYTYDAYVHAPYIKCKEYSDELSNELKAPIPKAKSIVIVHAGSENGFVPNALLMYKSYSGNGMNFIKYEKWLRTKLIPNLKPKSVVVIGNEPYHNKLKDPSPTSNSNKEDMELWLTKKGISYSKQMFKSELYNLIRQNKSFQQNFVVDDIFTEHNHQVLRLPPFHSDLNPAETAIANIMGVVVEKKLDINDTRTVQLIMGKIDQIGQKEWMALCKRVKNIEDQYRVSDYIIDNVTENFIICTGDSSESESDFEAAIDMPDSEGSDTELNISSTSASISVRSDLFETII